MNSIKLAAAGLAAMIGLSGASIAAPLTLTDAGVVGGTRVFSGDLTSLGLSTINSISIVDDNDGVGGADGIFSGADIDAVFIDMDGDLNTAGDRVFASAFVFSAGTTRPTGVASLLPNATHPGPTFGSFDATTIDLATATLDILDGVSVADVDTADGFLTLGDGGVLNALFNPAVAVGGTLFLFVGDVGANEALGAEILVNTASEPGVIALLGLGLVGLGFASRRRG